MMMDYYWWGDGYGLTHWLFFIAMVAIIAYPVGRILNRLGLSSFWTVLAFIPFVNLLALWALAFADWPERKSGG